MTQAIAIYRRIVRLALLVALAGGNWSIRVADAREIVPARIASCRVGIGGQFKVGFWTPVWVEVEGTAGLSKPVVEVTVSDSDGISTTMPAEVPEASSTEKWATCLLYTKIGKIGSEVHVKLLADGKLIDEIILTNNATEQRRQISAGLPATSELLLGLGATPFGMKEAFPTREGDARRFAQRTVELSRVADLPTEWFGYEGVDVIVLSAGDSEYFRKLAADSERFAALVRWVELGGRLVLLCGSHTEELLAEGGPLAPLLPGKFETMISLPQTAPLEHFAESATQVMSPGARIELLVPKLTNVEGAIEVYAGQKPTDLPLLIRAARGFGEITFVAVDVSEPPLANWPGRNAFLSAVLRPYIAASELSDAPQTLVTLGYNDLSGAARHWLGVSFRGVTTVPFTTVALFVLGYLLLLGPANYWLVCKVLQRPQLAWLTFPLLVLATSGGAWWLTNTNRGDQPRVNQIELADFDLAANQVRSTYWAALHSPEARRYGLALHPQAAGQQTTEKAEVLLSWLGLPGIGVGGMQAAGVGLGIDQIGYRYTGLNGLEGVPILTSATKSFLGRWTAPSGSLVSATLTDDDGLVVGTITNETGKVLHDARLLYGNWGYRLGDLAVGQKIDIGEELRPMHAKTLIMRTARGAASEIDGEADHAAFFAERASGLELLNLMMFYEAGGGVGFAQLPNRYQSYCDFSRLLQLGRAVLVANVDNQGSKLVDPADGQALADSENSATVVYRFVLPVKQYVTQ